MLTRRGVIKGASLLAALPASNSKNDNLVDECLVCLVRLLQSKYGGEWNYHLNINAGAVFVTQLPDGLLIKKSTNA